MGSKVETIRCPPEAAGTSAAGYTRPIFVATCRLAALIFFHFDNSRTGPCALELGDSLRRVVVDSQMLNAAHHTVHGVLQWLPGRSDGARPEGGPTQS